MFNNYSSCLINFPAPIPLPRLGCVICFVSIHVLLQMSVFYHHHGENEASYAIWLFCSKDVDYSLFTPSE